MSSAPHLTKPPQNWSNFPMACSIDLTFVASLYRKYKDDLRAVKEAQKKFHVSSGYWNAKNPPVLRKASMSLHRAGHYLKYGALLKPQLDDIEAEITYLRLRESKPLSVVEISPCGGWSTTWILRALRDNGQGHLYSFDLVDLATKNVPQDLSKDRWTFFQGDVTKNTDRLPDSIDYLFLDSDHSESFAKWYVENLIPRLKPLTPVSVHDIFHNSHPDGFSGEGTVIIEWLKEHQKDFFTASPAKAPKNYDSLLELRNQEGLSDSIHADHYNSMIFFEA